MTAFFVTMVTLKDAEKFQEYGAAAGPTIAAHGGKMLIRGKVEKVLTGNADHQMTAVASFPTMAALEGWYQSAEYQSLIPLRDEAADMTLVSYNEPA